MRPLPARWTLAAVFAVVALVAGSAQAAGRHHAVAGAAQAGSASATLQATVIDDDLATIVSFQYGTTTNYGSTTTTISVNALVISTRVSVTIGGLTPGVTYHYRVVANNLLGTTYGADQTFTIAATGGGTTVTSTTSVTASGGSGTGATVGGSTGSGTGSGGGSVSVGTGAPTGTTGATGATGASGSVGSGTAGAPAGPAPSTTGGGSSPTGVSTPGASTVGTVAPPRFQRSAVVSDTTGVVLVTPPGATEPLPVTSSVDVPNGTLVNAHAGVVNLTTALDTHGRTQTVMVWGGSFRLRYAHGQTGRVILALAGGNFGACAASAAGPLRARAARAPAHSTRSPHVVRSLWGSDNHGRYTTQGNNSVATVQGTVWRTEDRCDGTLTTVARGAVLVRDARTHRTVRVTTGHSYLARRAG